MNSLVLGSALPGLLIALAVGLIIGFERGWRSHSRAEGTYRELDEQTPMGIRTFGLLGFCGGVTAQLGQATGGLLLAAGVLGLALLLIGIYLHSSRLTDDYGATTEVAAMLTFLLGALAVHGFELEAAVAAVITAVLLGAKDRIHGLLRKLSQLELNASLQLLVIAIVVLPLLPNVVMGPWGSLNPQVIGWLVMLLASISFVGYFAVRILGDRVGLVVTAVLGGLTSSTALTLSYSRMARADAGRNPLLAAGIVLACATMAPRVLLEVSVVNSALVLPLLPGMLGLTLVPLLAAWWLLRKSRSQQPVCHRPPLQNPLDLQQTLLMALLLSVIFMLSQGAEHGLGSGGVYLLAVVAGVADVDAVSIALAQQARTGMAPEIAVRGILLAALINTAVKAGIVLLIGGRSLARYASVALGLALLVSASGLLI